MKLLLTATTLTLLAMATGLTIGEAMAGTPACTAAVVPTPPDTHTGPACAHLHRLGAPQATGSVITEPEGPKFRATGPRAPVAPAERRWL